MNAISLKLQIVPSIDTKRCQWCCKDKRFVRKFRNDKGNTVNERGEKEVVNGKISNNVFYFLLEMYGFKIKK